MTRYAYLAVIAAFALSACGQDDSEGMSQEGAAGSEQASGDDAGASSEYFDAAAKVGEVRDTGLGYQYVVVEHE